MRHKKSNVWREWRGPLCLCSGPDGAAREARVVRLGKIERVAVFTSCTEYVNYNTFDVYIHAP